MGVFEELKSRGLIAQTTNEEKVKDLLNNQKVRFYIGFDPTADSLHIGHFLQIIVMSHLQKAGHTPVALFGGGTGMIGDPSFKSDMRKMLTKEEISYNINCFKNQMSNLINFSDSKALMVNNADWLLNLNYIDFIREIGVHFPVNKMLAAECYKQRLKTGLSFFEMNYMIMQSYDFLVLNRKYNCSLELGGDDQWSNIIGGVELIRKMEQKDAYGMTFTLLTTSDGKKMGKTQNGAIWLDPKKTTPYEFYQYFRNVPDEDAIRLLKMITFIPLNEIEQLAENESQEINKIKELLAFEVTKLVHSEAEAIKAKDTAHALFSKNGSIDNMPQSKISKLDFSDDEISVTDLLIKSALISSRSEARRLIEQGGISIDDKKVEKPFAKLNIDEFKKGYIVIKKGKKVFHKVTL